MKRKSYSSFVAKPKVTAQTSVMTQTRSDQVQNHDGAFVYDTGNWGQLDRFLILGAAAPTYYASRRELVKDNTGAMKACIKENGKRFIDRAVEISQAGRAPSNDPAIFALALAVTHGDEATRTLAYAALPKIARIGTHLFHFVDYVNDMAKWNKGLQRAVSGWFNNRKPENLVYQLVKYRQRDGWSMADVMKRCHPAAPTEQHRLMYQWVRKGWPEVGEMPHPDNTLRIIWAFERAKRATTAKEIAQLVRTYKLPWEALDTKWLNENVVWDELIQNIKPEALIRNLSRLTANGFIKDFGENTKLVISKITDTEALISARVHPFKILTALRTYSNGRGDKGSLTWTPNQKVCNALDDAFYLAHKAVEPTGKRIMLALDVSGSMGAGQCGNTPFTPREACGAIAMTIAKTEPDHAFYGFSNTFMTLPIHDRMRLEQVTKTISDLPFAFTDCSLPFTHALKHKMPVDAFVVLTDNETNSGTHPSAAIKEYRQKMGIPAKLIVVGMTATNFTIADPKDPGMLDVVGLDTAVPELISNFIGDRFSKRAGEEE